MTAARSFTTATAPPLRGRDRPGRDLVHGLLLGIAAAAAWLLWAGLLPFWPVEGALVALALLGFSRPLPAQVGLLAPLCLTAAWMSALPVLSPFLTAAAAFFLANLLARTEAVAPFDLAHAGFALVALAAGGGVFALQHGPATAATMLAGSAAFLTCAWAGHAVWRKLRLAVALWRGEATDGAPAFARSLVP